MQIHEIAKATGLTSKKVAEDLGLDTGKGVAFREVVDEKAKNYIAVHKNDSVTSDVKKSGSKTAKFVSIAAKNHSIPSTEDDGRVDILIEDWTYEPSDKSVEAEYLRRAYCRDALRIWEVIDGQYEDDEVRMEFRDFLRSMIYTGGPSHASVDGVSTAGMRRVMAFLTVAECSEIPNKTVDAVVNAVVNSKHISNVTKFRGIE